MSAVRARDEILRFLKSPMPEVLCITGKWGVGKTYCWKQTLVQAQSSSAIALNRYAYVSLFGQNSLDDLKYAIFENTVVAGQFEKGPDFSTFRSSYASVEKFIRRYMFLANVTPQARGFLSSAGRALFLAVREQVVCIDDLERAGKGLEVKDVLGMISFLKEERKCKVVMLLNGDALEGDARIAFKLQLEKVVDTHLVFEPTPTEAVSIGVSALEPIGDLLRTNCLALRITNIRASLTSEDFTKLFKEARADDLRTMIKAALQFSTFGNPSETMKKIVTNATEALRSIGQESAINARRVRAYGIAVADPQKQDDNQNAIKLPE
jgi:hypothetical protein